MCRRVYARVIRIRARACTVRERDVEWTDVYTLRVCVPLQVHFALRLLDHRRFPERNHLTWWTDFEYERRIVMAILCCTNSS